MRPADHTEPEGALRSAPLLASGDWNRIPEITNVRSTGDSEPDLPMAFVPCRRCGEMAPLQAVECENCGAPHPRHVAPPASLLVAIRCVRCGDAECGPWLDADDGLICERCLDEDAA